MPRPFLQNVSFLVLINLLIKPVFIFGIDLAVQNRVGAAAYGNYFALFNFAFLFNVLLDFGINNFNQRLVARDPKRVSLWLPNILWVKGALTLAYMIAVFAMAVALGFDAEQLRLLGWIALGRVLVSFHMYFRSNVSGLQAFRTDAVLSVMDRLLTILLVGALLYTPLLGRPFTVQDFVYGTAVALAATALVSFGALRRLSGPLRLEGNRRLFRTVLKRAYPFALLGVLMTLYNRVDGVMLERMLGPDGDRQAGIYAAAYRLLDAGTMFAFLLAGILLPLLARMRKTGQDVWPIVRTSARLLFAISATASAIGIFYAQPLMNALYRDADPYWGATFALLIGGFVFNALVYVYGSLLTAESKLRGLNAIALTGVLLNFALNLILIPLDQARGAALATLVTQGLVALAHALYAVRIYSWRKVMLLEAARMLGFSAVLVAGGLVIRVGLSFLTGEGLAPGIAGGEPAASWTAYGWLIGAGLLGVVGLLAGLAFRLLEPRALLREYRQGGS